MSVQYDKEIFSNENLMLKVNFSGIKGGVTNTADLKMSIYAYDIKTGKPVFSEVLDFDEIKTLYEHLNQISIIKDSTKTTSGTFVETTNEVLTVLRELKEISPNILKTILDKLNGDEKINGLLNFLSDLELSNLSAAYKLQTYRLEIKNLELLLQLEKNCNIVKEIITYKELEPYIAKQPEKIFQNWIERNLWVFGVDYIKKHNHRKIAIFNESDLLMESMDGFLDLIELKRPKLDYDILKYDPSHKCYFPSPDLSKVIGQCLMYLQQLDNYKFNLEREYKVKIIRPRIKIILGRTNNFKENQFETLRMLNSNLNHIQIISYDYLLSCGNKMISTYE
ncbi:MAG: DUF4263 domain-containing protein [Candidatus Cloacimonetes bacterium]|nr:DUF4263 domain-containing protein [Candidatus Cloacimonadota bacterium]MBL7086553.1 DUF4263 domain-containing protein [Candidatus Cloacimonadota bacterium]